MKNKVLVGCLLTILSLPTFSKALTFTVGAEFPPNQYSDNGDAAGICVDVLKALSMSLNVEINFAVHPWKRANFDVKTGKSDGIVGVFITPERQEYMQYADYPSVMVRSLIVTHKDNTKVIHSLEDLKGKEVGVGLGYTYNNEFDHSTLFRRYEARQLKNLVEMLRTKRLEYIAVHEGPFLLLLQDLGYQDAFKYAYIMQSKPLYYAFSKNSAQVTPELIARFNKAMERLTESGKLDKILVKYGYGKGYVK